MSGTVVPACSLGQDRGRRRAGRPVHFGRPVGRHRPLGPTEREGLRREVETHRPETAQHVGAQEPVPAVPGPRSPAAWRPSRPAGPVRRRPPTTTVTLDRLRVPGAADALELAGRSVVRQLQLGRQAAIDDRFAGTGIEDERVGARPSMQTFTISETWPATVLTVIGIRSRPAGRAVAPPHPAVAGGRAKFTNRLDVHGSRWPPSARRRAPTAPSGVERACRPRRERGRARGADEPVHPG